MTARSIALAATLGCFSAIASGQDPRPTTMAHRSTVYAPHGMIATSQPLATAAGLAVLERGGNAIDAAVTAAAVLNVAEPMMTGIGGDVFAIVWSAKDHKLYGLNSSGRAGRLMTRDALLARGHRTMPTENVEDVTVPGALAGWDALLQRFGTITLAQTLAPAIGYAENGFPVTPVIARDWAAEAARLAPGDSAAGALPGGGARPPPQLGLDRRAGPRRAVRRRAGPADRQPCGAARRLPHPRRSARASARMGGADFRLLQGISRVGAAAQQSGRGGARDAAPGRAVRPPCHGAQFRSIPASLDRGKEARVRRRGALRRRADGNADAGDRAARRPLCRGAPRPDRPAPRRRSSRAGSGTHGERDHLSHGRRQRRQHGLLHQFVVRCVRVGCRRAGDRLRAAGPRRGAHARGGSPQYGRAGEASVPHAHPSVCNQARRAGRGAALDELRRDGRLDAAAGAPAAATQSAGVRAGPAGCRRRCTVPSPGRPTGSPRDTGRRAGAERTDGAGARARGRARRGVRRGAGDHAAAARLRGRLRPAQGRHGGRILTLAVLSAP